MTSHQGEATLRLSVPPRSVMPERALTEGERATLLAIADALIPGSATDPKASDAPDYASWLQRAVDARAEAFDRLITALASVAEAPIDGLWERLRQLNNDEPEQFHLVSSVVAGAYVMVPEVMAAIGYPGQKQNPAGVEEAVDQLADGILDPVIDRGHIFRAAP